MIVFIVNLDFHCLCSDFNAKNVAMIGTNKLFLNPNIKYRAIIVEQSHRVRLSGVEIIGSPTSEWLLEIF